MKINMYKRVLIADDSENEIDKLKDLLVLSGADVIYAKDPSEVYEHIEKKNIDLLVLDWYFHQPSNEYAIEIIQVLLDNKYYIPVFIYSNNIEDKEPQLACPKYPSVLLNSMSKPKPSDIEETKKTIDKWFKENPNLRLANKWYNSVQDALGKTLTEIYNRTDKGVINLLNQTYSTEQNDGTMDIIKLIMTILQENLLKESNIFRELQEIIQESNINKSDTTYDNYQQLRSLEMYANVDDSNSISTGDIFLLDNDVLKMNELCNQCITGRDDNVYAISVTAECDYARSSDKLRYHKFILGTNLYDICIQLNKKNLNNLSSFISDLSNHNNESLHYIPFVTKYSGDEIEIIENIVLDFQNVISVKKDTFDSIFKGKRICRLRTVYFQHLLRRYSTYSSRVGVPEIPSNHRKDLVAQILTEININDVQQLMEAK